MMVLLTKKWREKRIHVLKNLIKSSLLLEGNNSFKDSDLFQLKYGKVISYQEKYMYDHICTICQSTFDKDSKIIQLNCNHVFHQNCLEGALEYNCQCPICRKYILVL